MRSGLSITTPRRVPSGRGLGAVVAILAALSAMVALGVIAGAGPASAMPRGVSSNWSGYAVTGPSYSAVSASWVQPAATCLGRPTSSTYASFWVGLGGDSSAKTGKIEQIGTDSDCASDGTDYYYAWYELWPRDAVNLDLKISAGDRISASVKVIRGRVIVKLRNLTTRRGVASSVTLRAPDLSSAEWIAEAPSLPLAHGSQLAALTDFGTVRFTDAAATSAGGHTGTITDRAWQATAIDFATERHARDASPATRFFDDETGARGISSVPQLGGSAFSVRWKKGRATAEPASAGTV